MWGWTLLFVVVFLLVVFVAVPVGVNPKQDRLRQRKLGSLLATVTGALEQHRVSYWLDFGTLLGFHREHDIILGDMDCDVAALDKDRARVLEAVRQTGLSLDVRDNLIKLYNGVVGHACVDIAFYTPDPKTGLLRFRNRDHIQLQPDWVWPLRSATFQGHPIKVPHRVEAYLEYLYGDTYMTPIRNDKGRDGGRWTKHQARIEHVLKGWYAVADHWLSR